MYFPLRAIALYLTLALSSPNFPFALDFTEIDLVAPNHQQSLVVLNIGHNETIAVLADSPAVCVAGHHIVGCLLWENSGDSE